MCVDEETVIEAQRMANTNGRPMFSVVDPASEGAKRKELDSRQQHDVQPRQRSRWILIQKHADTAQTRRG